MRNGLSSQNGKGKRNKHFIVIANTLYILRFNSQNTYIICVLEEFKKLTQLTKKIS